MMALSKCVLDRVEEKKNKFKNRAYGLVEIMSRTVFARMERSTSVYKNLFDQEVGEVFDMFVHELNEAYGRDLESSLNQQINMGEEYGLDSEIEDDLLSISTFESQASSSSQQSHHKCIYRVKFYAEDGEEYYEEISEDRVEVIEVVDNDEIEEHFGEAETFGSDSILSENDQFDGDMSEDDQQFRSDDEELSVNGLSEMTNSASRLTTTIEINEEYVGGDITLPCNEDSMHQRELIEGPVKRMKTDKEVEEEEKVMDNDKNEEQIEGHDRDIQFTGNYTDLLVFNGQMDGEMSKDNPHVENDEDLVANCQVGYDENSEHSDGQLIELVNDKLDVDGDNDEVGEEYDDDATEVDDMDEDAHQHGDDQFNGLKHESNIDENTLTKNSKICQLEVSEKPPTGKYVCEHCGKTFKKPSGLAIHIRTHNGEKPFVCTWENCGKTFTQSEHLKTHMPMHTGEKAHDCRWKDCTEVFAYSVRMRQHFMVHVDKIPFKCPWKDCYRKFTQIGDFRVHAKYHTEKIALPEKSLTGEYICEHCGKGFKRRIDLTRHIRTHTGERPYECSFEGCNMRFALIKTMQTHQIIHTGMWPHVCRHCRKGFRTSGNLTKHICTHTGERH